MSFAEHLKLAGIAYRKKLAENPEYAKLSEAAGKECQEGWENAKRIRAREKDIEDYVTHGNGD